VKRAFVEVSSPGLLFRTWEMAGFWDVTDFRIWFGTYLDILQCCKFEDVIWGPGYWDEVGGWTPWGLFSLSISFLHSFPSVVVVAGLLLLYRYAMDDKNVTHKRLSTTLRHVKKSVTTMDVKIWQQPALGKREEAVAQENPEDLKLSMSPSREFVSRALVSSRK